MPGPFCFPEKIPFTLRNPVVILTSFVTPLPRAAEYHRRAGTYSHRDPDMADQNEARIVVKRGQNADMTKSTEVGVYEPSTGKYTQLGHAPGRDKEVEAYIKGVKRDLEKAGNYVSVKEM